MDDLPFNDIHITAKDLTEVPRLTDSPLSISSMKTSSVESSLISDTEHLQSHHQTLRLSNYDEDQSQGSLVIVFCYVPFDVCVCRWGL